MKSRKPDELDPEFDVLPSIYDRRDATDYKYFHDSKNAAAIRHIRLRNAIGAAGLLIAGGATLAHHVENVEFNTIEIIAIGTSVGISLSGANSAHRQAKQEHMEAARFGGYTASLFIHAGLEPPQWTEQP